MIKLLKNPRWELESVKGSHHKMAKEGYDKISVPFHGKKELRYGTQRQILKDSDLIHYWKNDLLLSINS